MSITLTFILVIVGVIISGISLKVGYDCYDLHKQKKSDDKVTNTYISSLFGVVFSMIFLFLFVLFLFGLT